MGDTQKNILDLTNLVKSQAKYHRDQIDRLQPRCKNGHPDAIRRKANHERLAGEFSKYADYLESGVLTEISESNSTDCVSPHLHFLPQDLEGLPQELLDEINLSDSDELELQVYDALKKTGGTLPVDKILIQIYRDTGKIITRKQLAAKLYRMAAKDKLIASQEHRGVYSLPDNSTDENPEQVTFL